MQYPKLLGLLATTARETLAKEIVIVTQSVLDKTHKAKCKESIGKKKKRYVSDVYRKKRKEEKKERKEKGKDFRKLYETNPHG